ncbi:MAG: PKD domain-containing protein [Bacteroidota bacterium]|nr:PKD domain-containing protein [Bacteroidota bacterium]
MFLSKKYILPLLFFVFPSLCSFAHEHPETKASLIRFTENKNQWDGFIKYRAQLDGGALFLQTNRLTYHFYDKDTYRSMHASRKIKVKEVKRHWFHVNFLNSNPGVVFKSHTPSSDYNNYFIGNDKSKWAGNVKNYKEVVYQDLWKGINLQMIGNDNSIKYNFYVAPGAKISDIKLNYEGVKSIKLKNKTLTIATTINEIVEHEPYAFQLINGIKTEVPCNFKLKGTTLSYEFPNGYDENYELVIDPVLVFACSSGSTADNFGMTATYDEEGNLYSGGTAFNVGFPTTTGAFDSTFSSNTFYGQTDVVITKYDSSGVFLRYSTYIGGSSDAEVVNSLIVDASNNLYLYAVTASNDYPVTTTAYDQTFNGGTRVRFYNNGAFFEHGTDICISKLNATGTALVSSTFMGGSLNDGLNYTVDSSYVGTKPPYGDVYEPVYDSLFRNYGDQNRGEIQLDNNGNVIIVSTTRSLDFPIVNGFDITLGGKADAVIMKLSSDLSSLVWSSFFGGNSMESGNAVCVDADNNIFITGGTCSSDMTATSGAYTLAYVGGKSDGYIAKIKYDGTQLLHSTFIGTGNYDQNFFVQLDNSANVYVFGQSLGTMAVVNAVYSVVNGKQYITKLDSTLSTLLMQTKFGNGSFAINISPSAFLVDCANNIYLSGWGGNILTGSVTNNMPLTANAHQSTTDGFNFYLMVLAPNASSLLYATYFGGASSREHVDGGTSRFDKKGIIYQSVCAGCWGNNDFPVTPGAWPTSVLGSNINQGVNNDGAPGCNNGTFKFNFEYAIPVAQITTSGLSGCTPLTVNFANTSISTAQYLWDFGNNDTTSSVNNPIRTFTTPGTYTVMLLAKNNSCFNVWDTAFVTVTVHPKPTVAYIPSIVPCSDTFNFANTSSILSGTISHAWSFGDNTFSSVEDPSHVYAPLGTYTTSLVVTSDKGCKDSLKIPVQTLVRPDSVGPGISYCPEAAIPYQLFSTGGTTYQWTPSAGLSNTTISNPVATPTVTTNYLVTISETDWGGNNCASTDTVKITVHPKPIVAYTPAIVPCTDSFNFVNTSSISSGTMSYAWSFGDNTFSVLEDPSHTYSPFGTYTTSLIVTSDKGCIDSLKIPVQTTVRSDSVGLGIAYCPDFAQPYQLFATGGTSYQWSPSAGLSNPTISNPVATPSATTNYVVTITETDWGGNTCTTVDTVKVAIYPDIISDFNLSVNNCGNTVTFSDMSVSNATAWSWDFNDGDSSHAQNPIHSYAIPGTYSIILAVENNFGCVDTVIKPLTIGGFNPLSVSASQNICNGNSVQLNATGGISYSWAPTTALSNSNIANPIATPTTTTIYTVTITTINTVGDTCISNLATSVQVASLTATQLIATANPDTIAPGETSYINTNIGSPLNIQWTPNYNLSSATAYDPLATPGHTTTYSAIVTNSIGCKFLLDSVTIYVITNLCDEGSVFVPNTFSPNLDGSNDVLYVRSNFVTDLYFAVYNRWGQMVFETTDIKKGWDGIYNGMKSDPGVFGYYLKYKCNNGEESFRKGNVTLVR